MIRIELKNAKLCVFELLDLVKNSENGTISNENENSNLKPPDQLYTSGFQRELLGS